MKKTREMSVYLIVITLAFYVFGTLTPNIT